MYRCFIICIVAVAFSSCKKSDFTVEDTFINVFESKATLAKQTYDGGIVLFSYEGNIPIVYKIDNEGNKAWKKDISSLFASHANLSITSLAPDRDGGCLLGGNFYIDTATYYRSVVLFAKLDKNGEISFENNGDTLFIAGDQKVGDIIQCRDGNWVGIIERELDNKIVRINSQGHIVLKRSTPVFNFTKKILQTADDGIASLVYFDKQYYFFKYDSALIFQIGKPIINIDPLNTGEVLTIATDFIETPSSDLLVCGHSTFLNNSSSNNFDYFIAKFNSLGDSIFTKSFSNTFGDYSKNIILTRDQKVLITGTESAVSNAVIYSYSYTRADENKFYKINSSSRCFVIKLSTDLSQIWAKSYGNGFGSDGLVTVERPDGSYLICGNQVSYGNKNAILLFTIKALKNGNLP